MASAPRKRRVPLRRRVEDEGDDEGGPYIVDIDEESTDSGGLTDDDDGDGGSDTSNIDDASPTSANARKLGGHGGRKHGNVGGDANPHSASVPLAEPFNKLSLDNSKPIEELDFEDIAAANSPTTPSAAPVVVSSASATRPPVESIMDRRRREHDEYRKKRDEDPAFVPNRGAFFMHDHRLAGPSANGFRPSGRGRGRGGRGGFGGMYGGIPHTRGADPTMSGPWTHDMHEVVAHPPSPRPSRGMQVGEGPPNGNGVIPTCQVSSEPINRTLSTEKTLGIAVVRVYWAGMEKPLQFPNVALKQYTKLPDHRPPLRRDKPVRISIPGPNGNTVKYIFPATDRSFIFIPRAMRPNQKPGLRGGKVKSGLGSIGGFSRRTSVWGGSSYYGGSMYGGGSMYSPSIALSRRSSVAHDGVLFSPTGSVVSRAPVPADMTRPIVRLPPQPGPPMPPMVMMEPHQVGGPPPPPMVAEPSITSLPQPQTHPLPQKPMFQENRPEPPIPMHQPRPQKTVSVADIESPTFSQHPPPQEAFNSQQQQYQGTFHHQIPLQISNVPDHSRNPSHQSHPSTGTPLSQIPERAIHAAPFQPGYGQQQSFYSQQTYQPAVAPQQGYYYPPNYTASGMPPSSAAAPAFVPGAQQGGFVPPTPPAPQAPQPVAAASSQNVIMQEVNGTMFYFDPSQIQASNGYTGYSPNQQGAYVPGVVPMGSGMVNPNPGSEAFYPYQQNPGMVYYQQ